MRTFTTGLLYIAIILAKGLSLTQQAHSKRPGLCRRSPKGGEATSKTFICSTPFENNDHCAIWLRQLADKPLLSTPHINEVKTSSF